MGVLSNGFITADLAGQNSAADIAVHNEISLIENEILVQSNLGFLSVNITDTPMTSVGNNSPILVQGVNSTAVTSGNSLVLSTVSNIVSGMSVRDMTTPNAISGSITVASLDGNNVILSGNVSAPGVLNGDILYFSNLTRATSEPMAAYKDTIWLGDTSDIQVGMIVEDKTVPNIIVPGTTVTSIGSGESAGSIQISTPFIGNMGLGDLIEFSFSAVNISTGQSTLTLASYNIPTGTPITLTTTNSLPTPLLTNTVYYLVDTSSSDVYQLAATMQDSLLVSPNIITITSVPTGTNYTIEVPVSELYFNAWQDVAFNPEYRMYVARMKSVMDYFTNLGYFIERRQNGTKPAFIWYVRWN